jgi:polyisoprenyl-teichoic acid--peptidoglycan teichoic acid transferase
MSFNKNKSARKMSIDGFATPKRKSLDAGAIEFKRGASYKPNRPLNSLDNFSRAEGLSANRASVRQSLNVNEETEKPTPSTIENALPYKKERHFEAPEEFKKKSRFSKLAFWKRDSSKPPLSRKKKILRGFIIFLVILGLIGGFLFAKGYINLRKALQGGGGAAALDANVDPSKLKGEGDGRINILPAGRGGEGHDGPDLTDTLIFASIDPVQKQVALVSIPRDLYVNVPNYGSMKINAAFATGKSTTLNKLPSNTQNRAKQAEDKGFEVLSNTIETTLGVPVHYHAMVDFAGFEKAIDTVGGVDVNVKTTVKEQMRINGRNYMLDVPVGNQHFDGFRALAYSRSRYTSARGDFDRAERQREMIIALKTKAVSLGTISNPSKISGLMDAFGGHVTTDFSVNDLNRLYALTKDIQSNNIVSVGLADPPNDYVTTGTIAGQSVVIPRAGVGNYKQIQSYIRNTLKDSFLKNENAKIVVLNGTNVAGLATRKSDELKSYGYNVTKVDNAPTKNYNASIIVDLRGGQMKYTRSYLEKRFKGAAVNNLPDANIVPGDADFVIIIGTNTAVED